MAKRMFNCDNHKFHIKGESVAKTGFWIAKKRYALDKVYDLEANHAVNKMVVKGLDVVRSSFPQAFREFMKQLLKDILQKMPKDEMDAHILEFKSSLKNRHYLEVARNISANNISEFSKVDAAGSINTFKKGTPAHIKAAIVYNRLLEKFDISDRYEPIRDGEKIKYVLLKSNELRIEAVAVKGYNDPLEIIKLIEEYIDIEALFDNELRNKLQDFYNALGWNILPTDENLNASDFFSF